MSVACLTVILDQLCFFNDLNNDFRPDEIISTSSVQEVDTF